MRTRGSTISLGEAPALIGAVFIANVLLAGAGCERAQRPASFSPAEEVLRTGDTVARCNTVHSLTLPKGMLQKVHLAAGPDEAILSCSLQVMSEGVPRNVAANVHGTATPLGGGPRSIDFKTVIEDDTISYVAAFDIAAKVGIRFDIVLDDPRTGARHRLAFTQTSL